MVLVHYFYNNIAMIPYSRMEPELHRKIEKFLLYKINKIKIPVSRYTTFFRNRLQTCYDVVLLPITKKLENRNKKYLLLNYLLNI